MRCSKSTALLRGKFIARQANIKKKEKHQIKKKKKLTIHLMKLEKEEQQKPKVS